MMTKKILYLMLLLVTLVVVYVGVIFYRHIFGRNVFIADEGTVALYIPTGTGFEDLMRQLSGSGLIRDQASFRWLAARKNLPKNIRPGKYRLTDGMSNNELVNLFRSGRQEMVQLTFTSLRKLPVLAGVVGRQIEADSADIAALLMSRSFLEQYNLSVETVYAVLIPNTYEFYWNSSAERFILRMLKEYKDFWTEERDRKAKVLGLSRMEVSILASIIDEETNFDDEKARIAGVYINRLNRGIPLQADPTIRFAVGDFSIKRVLTKHLTIDSPYNTYRNRGLPPGPVRIPSITGIESVLNAERHDYLYFCARDDFSGYHHFSRTLEQHNQYASRYRSALNRNRILR